MRVRILKHHTSSGSLHCVQVASEHGDWVTVEHCDTYLGARWAIWLMRERSNKKVHTLPQDKVVYEGVY